MIAHSTNWTKNAWRVLLASFNQNLPDEQVAFSNDTESDGPISEQDA